MGVGLALAPVRLRGATARAVRAETKVSGRRSLADSRGREPLRRVPAARVSAREGLAARRRASVVPAASKKTLDAVTYAFAEDGTAAVLDAPVGASGDSTVTSSGSSDTERDAAASPLAASSGAAPAAPASPAPDLERLTFEPSRVADLREASSAAAAATSGPAQGQTDESAMAAFTSDDMLCMLYGVDQDKEDAKYKVAFFDLDAVVAAEALRDAAAAVRAHVAGGASEFEFDASRLSERSGALAGRDVDSFAFAAARPGWLPGWLWRPVAALVAFLAQTFANREALSESGKHDDASRVVCRRNRRSKNDVAFVVRRLRRRARRRRFGGGAGARRLRGALTKGRVPGSGAVRQAAPLRRVQGCPGDLRAGFCL
jgi:hypothetical protein